MSRTVKGRKADGFEYWAARPGNRHGGFYSRRGHNWQKKATHRAERRQGRVRETLWEILDELGIGSIL